MRAARPVDYVEGGDEIHAFEGVAVKAHAQRVAIGEAETLVDVVNRCAESLGELHCRFKTDRHARRVFRQQQWIICGDKHVGGLFDDRWLRRDA